MHRVFFTVNSRLEFLTWALLFSSNLVGLGMDRFFIGLAE